MDYPELFYGVNLERIPKRRMRFTKGILVGEYRVDVNELRFIASKQELEILKFWEDMRMTRLMKQLNSNIEELNRHLKASDMRFHASKAKKK